MLRNDNEGSNADPFKVYVRVRPFLERELEGDNRSLSKPGVSVDENAVRIPIN